MADLARPPRQEIRIEEQQANVKSNKNIYNTEKKLKLLQKSMTNELRS